MIYLGLEASSKSQSLEWIQGSQDKYHVWNTRKCVRKDVCGIASTEHIKLQKAVYTKGCSCFHRSTPCFGRWIRAAFLEWRNLERTQPLHSLGGDRTGLIAQGHVTHFQPVLHFATFELLYFYWKLIGLYFRSHVKFIHHSVRISFDKFYLFW